MEAITIPCRTLTSIAEELGFGEIHLLQIDAEGMDGMVMESFDWHRWKPDIVQFECCHLPIDELTDWFKRLHSYGYRFAKQNWDICAFQPRLLL